jgi:hypothetical protein
VRIADRTDAVDDVQDARDQKQDRDEGGTCHSSIHDFSPFARIGRTRHSLTAVTVQLMKSRIPRHHPKQVISASTVDRQTAG